ncbi:hypothetical protein GCM10019016_103490 [Streptomyces prasinosporus]|uniref:SAP domain-containing protein n=1 Tax=Streptomyces prasinosporus TaxID=68256 RepID=A0ABP6U9K8_9ACTN
MDQTGLLGRLRAAGVPARRGRASAIRQLLLQAPAPVVARAPGHHDRTATHLVTEAGGTGADVPLATTVSDHYTSPIAPVPTRRTTQRQV